MLNDFIIIDKNEKVPLYRQIYKAIRLSIENGSLKKETKLPSIRRLSDDLGVSKITISTAYDQLCVEGYIKNKPQSGYYVEAEFNSLPQKKVSENINTEDKPVFYKYDFSGKSIDENIINIVEWKKSVKDTLNQNYLLTSYGDVQGEKILRNALQKYSLGTRSVNTKAENIVVGAGTQPLLYLLCSLLGENKKVAMADSSYVQSEFVFKSFGYEVCYFLSDDYGAIVSSLDKIKPDIILLNPNFTEKSGENMPVTRRLEIIRWAKNNNAIIIEDDYNGELRYSTHPVPCIQNYDTENTVYLGSFSKVLLPSVRISYMSLPDKLLSKYDTIKSAINQTASKVEQLALAKYIENGKIDIHLRKARRVYLEKSKVILENVEKYLGDNAKVVFNETSMYVAIKLKSKCSKKEVFSLLEKSSIGIMPIKSDKDEFHLSFSGITIDKIADGIRIFSEIIL